MIGKNNKTKFTDRRIIFAEQYLIHNRNATIAYKAVYGQDLNDNTAAVNASKLLRNPKIREYLAERLNVMELDSNYVLKKLKSLAENAKSDGTKLQAVIAIGKSLGMFSDNIVIDHDAADERRKERINEYVKGMFNFNAKESLGKKLVLVNE